MNLIFSTTIIDGPAYFNVSEEEFNHHFAPFVPANEDGSWNRLDLDARYDELVYGKAPVDFITEREAAIFLGVTCSTLRTSRHTGTLCGKNTPQYYKYGKRVLYKTGEVMSWLDGFKPVSNTSEY